MTNDPTLWSYAARSVADSQTGLPLMEGTKPSKTNLKSIQFFLIFPEDMYMHSRFLGYSMLIKSMAFIPCVFGFVIFFILVAVYGRISAAKSNAANKTIEV